MKIPRRVQSKIKTGQAYGLLILAGVLLWAIVLPLANRNDLSGIEIFSVAFSKDDKYLAVASLRQGLDDQFHWSRGVQQLSHGGVQLWRVSSQQIAKTVCLFGVPYNPNSTVGAFYSNDGQQLVVRTPQHMAGNHNAVVYNSSNLQVTGENASSYIAPDSVMWGDSNAAEIKRSGDNFAAYVTYSHRTFKVPTPRGASFLAVDPLHDNLAIADSSGGVTIYDVKQRKTIAYVTVYRNRLPKPYDSAVISSLLWLPKYNLLWLSDWHGRSMLWDAASKQVKASRTFSDRITCAAINHKGDSVAYGTDAGRLEIIPVPALLNLLEQGMNRGELKART